jgi:hypothetical protein
LPSTNVSLAASPARRWTVLSLAKFSIALAAWIAIAGVLSLVGLGVDAGVSVHGVPPWLH